MVYLVLAAVVWGSSFPVIRYALDGISPMLFVVLRFLIAFLVLLPKVIADGRVRTFIRRDVFLVSLPNAFSFILQFKAQELTTASKTALFVNSTPIFVAVFAFLFLREKFSGRQLAALVIAFAGVIITSTRLDFSEYSALNFGDMLAVCVGACWGLFIVFSRRIVTRYSGYELACALYFWTWVIALPLVPFETIRLEWTSVIAVLYLAFFATILGYSFYLRGLRRVSALSTSIVILIEIIVAFAISYFLLSESFTGVETVGVVLVLAGVLMVVRKENGGGVRGSE